MANISTTTDLVINRLSQAKYNQLCAAGQLNEYQLYITDDNQAQELSNRIDVLSAQLSDYLSAVPITYKTYDATVSSLSTDGYASTESLTAYAKTSDLSDLPTIKQDIVNLGAVSSDFQLTAAAGSMAYESKDNYLSAVPTSYKTYAETKSDLSSDGYALREDTSRVFIQDPNAAGYEDGKISDLSVMKVSVSAYAQILKNGEIPPNALYVVSGDNVDMYGQQVKNIADATESADAVSLQQLQTVIAAIPLSVSQLENDNGYISAVPDTYALKTDIPSADDISSEIHLSDYSLTSHNHDGTYLKEVPAEYKTYDATVSSLSASGYALSSDVSNSITSINEKTHQLANALSNLFPDSAQPYISSIGFQNIISCMYNLYAILSDEIS